MFKSYSKKFYKNQRTGSSRSAGFVVPILIDYFKPVSVLDIGCGVGTWLKEFEKKGINDIFGVDGAWVRKKDLLIKEKSFLPHDLTKPLNLKRKFDLCISLEVAEHIDAKYAETFVENLVKHSDIVVFSAAYPNVRGRKHINLQYPEYWDEIFKKYNYQSLDLIRPKIWNNKNVEWWYKQDILVFLNKNKNQNDFTSLIDNYPLSIVHPGCFEKYANPKHISIERYIKIFPSVVFHAAKRYMNKIKK